MRRNKFVFGCTFLGILMLTCGELQDQFGSNWPENVTRHWIGPNYWSNRIQDWCLSEGRLECLEGTLPLRTVHLLTRELTELDGSLKMSVEIGAISKEAGKGVNAIAGFLIGAGDLDLHYKARAQVHHASGNNGGLIAGIQGDGRLVFRDNEDSLCMLASEPIDVKKLLYPVRLTLLMEPSDSGYQLTLKVQIENRTRSCTIDSVDGARLTGNVALVAHRGGDYRNQSFWFKNWLVGGSKVAVREQQAYGPVHGVLYTQSRGVLKLTAQMPIISPEENHVGYLESKVKNKHPWIRMDTSRIVTPGWTLPFRVENWDRSNDYEYRIVFDYMDQKGKTQTAYYFGNIPKEPDWEEITIAAFTGNYNGKSIHSWKMPPDDYDFSHNRMWFPHADLDAHVKKHNPDLLVYTGDQIYESSFVRADKSGAWSSYIDYFNKWLLFSWAHEDLTRNIPTVCITDDHDVYQINYWGEGGKKARDFPEADSWEEMVRKLSPEYQRHTHMFRHDGGGYELPADWVNMVQRTQCSHLPDPVHPDPIEQGIETYYTDMLYGGVSFAILEDRKFKSAPRALLPEANIRNGFPLNLDYDCRRADHPKAELLGDQQLQFLENWSSDWPDAFMKIVLSATVFGCVNSEPKNTFGVRLNQLKNLPEGEYPTNYAPSRDMDTNGWPQTGRNKALKAIRKGFGFMIAGDQHLGSIVHHGVDKWEDAGYSFCVPANGNIAPRRWFTQKSGGNHQDSLPPYTGRYFDAFGNRMTVWAASNPYVTDKEPAELYDRATGYGIIRLNKKKQEITMECWPRWSDPAVPDAEQYEGWPKIIRVEDNYARTARAWLPEIHVTGLNNPPVVQVIHEASGEIVYTVRASSSHYHPKVFQKGLHTIMIGEPGTEDMRTIERLNPVRLEKSKTIEVRF
ncbi:alkaline phosphatase D family protein [candidate division KSB1 bacterium]|nr:alkaline phosphatase D family protein [candidate division KSB1 bacterium]